LYIFVLLFLIISFWDRGSNKSYFGNSVTETAKVERGPNICKELFYPPSQLPCVPAKIMFEGAADICERLDLFSANQF